MYTIPNVPQRLFFTSTHCGNFNFPYSPSTRLTPHRIDSLTGLPIKGQFPSKSTVLVLPQVRLENRMPQLGGSAQRRIRCGTVRVINLILVISAGRWPGRR